MNSSSVFEMETISAFVTVADCANFTMAARKLNLTQSTISQQIKRLEDRVGKTLFLRSTRSVSLTEDGLILLDYARSMLQIAQEAHARLLSPAISGRLSVAASDDLASHWLPAVLRRYHQSYPNVRLEINVGVTDELLKGVDSDGYDLVIAKSLKKTANINIIGSDQLIWVGNPELIPVAGDPVPLALFSEGCIYRRAAINSLNNAGYKWEAIVTSPSLNAIHSAVKSGIAIAPLAQSFAPENAPTIFTELPALPVIYFTLTVSPASVLKTEVIRFLEIVDEF